MHAVCQNLNGRYLKSLAINSCEIKLPWRISQLWVFNACLCSGGQMSSLKITVFVYVCKDFFRTMHSKSAMKLTTAWWQPMRSQPGIAKGWQGHWTSWGCQAWGRGRWWRTWWACWPWWRWTRIASWCPPSAPSLSWSGNTHRTMLNHATPTRPPVLQRSLLRTVCCFV